MNSSRIFVALAAAGVLALSGCGSDSSKPAKLTSADQQQLLDETKQLSTQLQGVATQTVTCAKQAILGGGEAGVQKCMAAPLAKAQTTYANASNWIHGLADRVSGDCKAKLNDFADAAKATGDALGAAAGKVTGKDSQGFQANISKLADAGTKLQKAASGIGAACNG